MHRNRTQKDEINTLKTNIRQKQKSSKQWIMTPVSEARQVRMTRLFAQLDTAGYW